MATAMKFLAFLSFQLLVVWAALASHTLKERVEPPRGWAIHSHAPDNHIINLRIGLPQPNFHVLEEHLYAVSDPSHERYGAHLSKEESEALVLPTAESVEAVTSWLESHGLPRDQIVKSATGGWLLVAVPVSQAESMLRTKYHVWKHTTSGEFLVRTTEYSLPESLHAHIDLVQPTTLFSSFKQMRSTIHSIDVENQLAEQKSSPGPAVDASCNTTITISCLRQIYNAVNYTSSATVGNSIAVTGYLEEFANRVDLQSFYANQVPAAAAVNSTFNFISVANGLDSQNASEAGGEANLDVQFAFGLSFPANATFYSTAGRPPFIPSVGTPTDSNEPYTEWLDFILGQKNPPLTISTSYGDEEQTVPESFAKRVCSEFAILGARGVTLTFSSGDGGVGDGDPDPATTTCLTNDGHNTTRFIPGFPASCPFVTAVGGTTHFPEVAASFSGGGFSNYFSRPSYQDAAVTRFLSKLPKGTYQGLFNASGRAIPDVSAQSERFRVFIGGRAAGVSGTSASSPAFAGFVAQLNDARLRKRLPPLGFLNPLLYTVGVAGLNDITVGSNPGCGTPGFNATTGWDPVTGLGTPDFGKLVSIVTNV